MLSGHLWSKIGKYGDLHDLAVHEVLGFASDFPDRHIFFLPDTTDVIGQASDSYPQVVAYGLAVFVVQIDTWRRRDQYCSDDIIKPKHDPG